VLFRSKLFACPNFFKFTNELIPNKFSEEILVRDETRLLIHFFDENKVMYAYQGRTIRNSSVKYITIILDDSKPKVYGLDQVDLHKTVNVVEGPIDSMFLTNSIATAGGDLVSAISSFPKANMVMVYDN
jgi:hypothetical protein